VTVIAEFQHESPLGRWRFTRWAPGPSLAGCVTVLRDLESRDAYTRERILAREAGISHKHLIALFARRVGRAPKPFARVVRFNALVDHLKRRSTADWTELAHRFGYSDHTHFARELRRFAGTSPSEFLQVRGPDGDTVVVATPR
jgi:AraC-like DNA-binding protein